MLPAASRNHYRQLQRLQAVLLLAVRRAWQRMSVTGSWSQQYAADVGPKLAALVAAAQIAAARESDRYIAEVLTELGVVAAEPGILVPTAFAGHAGDGRELATLLAQAVPHAGRRFNGAKALAEMDYDEQVEAVATLRAAGHGNLPEPTMRFDRDRAARQALDDTQRWVEMVAQTILADAARAAESAAMVARPEVGGWVRMLNPPSCSRCAILAGRFYRWNEGFERHPRCFPAGVIASGPSVEAAARRWYQGELSILTTASGQQLALTANHPVLTSRGWIPANLVKEGDEVFRSTRTEGASALVVPDHDQVPSLVEDVWRSLSVHGLDRMPSSPEDFHGDGQYGEVDVVYADGPLRRSVDSAVRQELVEQLLTERVVRSSRLDSEGVPQLVDLARAAHSRGSIGTRGLGLSLGVGHPSGSNGARLAHAPAFNASIPQNPRDGSSAHVVLAREGVLTGSGLVGGNNLVAVDDGPRSRWDASSLPDPVEQGRANAEIGMDLANRLSGQVASDRVILNRSVEFSGHVYSLTSSEGWISANSLIVSNCDCVHIPASESLASDLRVNPNTYFDSLSPAEQDRIFTKAGAQAIRDGADINQIVNARRGMRRAQLYGHDVLLTAEGTTRRGFARTRTRSPRLMPESIYQIAGNDRDEAIRLLRAHGFIL